MSVRYGLLGLLAQEPRHGYELHSAFVALMGGRENWDVKAAQVYSTLARLQESGLIAEVAVEQEGGPEKHILAITAAGQRELEEWFATPALDENLHDEVFVKLILGLALGDGFAQKAVQAQRAALYRELHRVTAQRQQANPKSELAYILLLDKTVMHLEADLRWLDMVEARLDEMRRQPLPQPDAKPRGRPRKGK